MSLCEKKYKQRSQVKNTTHEVHTCVHILQSILSLVSFVKKSNNDKWLAILSAVSMATLMMKIRRNEKCIFWVCKIVNCSVAKYKENLHSLLLRSVVR